MRARWLTWIVRSRRRPSAAKDAAETLASWEVAHRAKIEQVLQKLGLVSAAEP